MGKLDKLGQQIEGTIDEIKGNIQQSQGDTVKGGLTKMGGKLKKATTPFHDLNDDREDERR